MLKFNFTYDSNVSFEQRLGFEMAAAIWSSLLTDDVTINLRIGATDQLGENGQAVGGAIPIFHETHYGVYQEYLQQDATSDKDASVLAALQEGNSVDILVDTDGNPNTPSELVDGNSDIMLTRAQAKALGMETALVLDNGSTWDRDVLQAPNALDGYIQINNSYNWNYDLTRESAAPEGTLDFLTMALHEIGHSLGFVSGLDGLLDTFTLHSGETRTEGFTALDLMRYSETSAAIENPDGSISDLSFGGTAYFSIDGGQTNLAEFEEGNTYQASHWQRFRNAIGIMDPTLGYQERTDISHLDLQAFDTIGWDVNYAALEQGLDLQVLHEQAQQAVATDFGVNIEVVEAALTTEQDWLTLGYKAWFNAFQTQVLEHGWDNWFQDFEPQILEQGWGTWFQDFEAQMLEQGWGTWFQDFEAQMLEQGWGTWFQDFEAQMLEQGWGTWFQALEDQLLQQMWGTWFQAFEGQMLEQLWGTWFQDFEAQVLEQGWGTWFQDFEAQVLEQGWGTWFLDFEGQILNQNWGTWFQQFDLPTLNQSWGSWFQTFDAQILEQGWGTWFQQFELQVLEQGWGSWFQDFESQLLEQGWGTWFQEVDNQLLEQGWGTWFQKFEEQVLEQGWGTWWQQIEQHNTTLDVANTKPSEATQTTMVGGATDDILGGSARQDLISGSAGDDLIDGKEGNDIILGDGGNDIVYGWHGKDVLFGGVGDDLLSGENDNDQVYGEKGHDILSGGRGDDYLDGGAGRDVLRGDTGNDVLEGGTGDDKLKGNGGQDLLIGGHGQDIIEGGSNNDVLYGDDYFAPLSDEAQIDNDAANNQDVVALADSLANLDFRIRLEAEDMKLKNYSKDVHAGASGGEVIKTQGKGTAKTTFNGPSGIYDLVVGYEDQAEGTAEITLVVKGQDSDTEYTWQLNGVAGSGTHTISGVTLKAGDRIELKGNADGENDLARLDYLDIITTGSTASTEADTSTTNFYQFVGGNDGQQADIRIEVEDLELSGTYSRYNTKYASGDAVIVTSLGGTGTATYTYTGPTGTYNLYANYFDNILGQATATVFLNETTLDSWVFNQDDFATHDRTLGLNVTLNQGDTIQIQSEANWLDLAAIDYLRLEHISAAEPEANSLDETNSLEGALQLEVEHMNLSEGARIEQNASASGDAFVRTGTITNPFTTYEPTYLDAYGWYYDTMPVTNTQETATGKQFNASSLFSGETGYYDIVVGYYDESDGAAEIIVKVDNQELDRWFADQDLGTSSINVDNLTTRTVAQGIQINNSDLIEPTAIGDASDQGNVDYIKFIAVDPPSDLDSSEPIRVEAEDMTLSGGYVFENQDFASGERLIKTYSSFTATTEFIGSAGLYNIVIGYHDENDGNSPVTVKLDGLTLDSWVFDQNLGHNTAGTNNFVTRTVATEVALDAGAVLEIQGSNNSGEFARIDYIEFVPVEAPEISQPDINSDILRGGAGNDIAYGGAGDDLIYGDSGNDVLYGDGNTNKSTSNIGPTEGLVGHWTFDESTGGQASDTTGVHPGTLTNMSSHQWATGPLEGALTFDGSDDRVEITDSVALNITDTLTLTTWVKADTFASWNGLIVKGRTNIPYGLDLRSDGRLIFQANYGAVTGGSGSGTWSSNTALTAGQWHHVAITYDGSNFQFYLDGQLDGTHQADITFGTNNEALVLGADLAGGSHFDGTLDDSRVYNRALSTDEIAQLAQVSNDSDIESASMSAMQFDGDDALTIDHASEMLLDNGTLSFSFQADDVSTTQGLFSKDSSGYDDGGHFTIYVKDGELVVRLQSTNSTYFVEADVVAGQSHDVAITFGTRGLELWLDGNLVDTNHYTGGLGTSSGGSGNYEPIVLGANQWNSGNLTASHLQQHFTGMLQDVRLYDQQLSSANIHQLPTHQPSTANVVFEELVTVQNAQDLPSNDQNRPGNDTLIGGTGNDKLYGGEGDDILNGTDEFARGLLEQDHLTGGSGADQFILGDAHTAYYNHSNEADHATISDFKAGVDTIQLHGAISDYQQSQQSDGVSLYYKADLIAQFEAITALDLNSSVTFV